MDRNTLKPNQGYKLTLIICVICDYGSEKKVVLEKH